MRMQRCEWCEELATSEYTAHSKHGPYKRYACRIHHVKTGQLALLDGHKPESLTITLHANGFPIIVGDRGGNG